MISLAPIPRRVFLIHESWKTKMRLLVAATISVLVPSTSVAINCRDDSTALYFGNGMSNSQLGAEDSAAELQKHLHRDGIKISYNANEFFLREFLQAAHQKEEEYGRRFWQYLRNLSRAPEAFRKLARSIAVAADSGRYIVDADLQRHVASYLDQIQRGGRVIVVAHSQGNFYANSSWYLVGEHPSSQGRMALVGAAVPTSEVAGGGAYTTHIGDLYMRALQVFDALPANDVSRTLTTEGHEFVEQYLAGDKSGPKIRTDVAKAIVDLNSNGPVDLADRDFVHASLQDFWLWVNGVRAKPLTLSAAQCLAISAFAKTYDWWAESCDARSLKSIETWLTTCLKTKWKQKDRFEFDECSLLGNESTLSPRLDSTTVFSFVREKHPECIWSVTAAKKRITAPLVGQAKQLLKKPR